MHLTDHPDGEAAVRSRARRAALRAARRSDRPARRARGASRATSTCSRSTSADGRVRSDRYPDALGRVWSALRCRTAGEVLASARPGWEFLDWGRSHHIGGGSHGSLHAERLARLAAVVRHGPGRRRRARAVDAARRRPDGPGPLRRVTRARRSAAAIARRARARRCVGAGAVRAAQEPPVRPSLEVWRRAEASVAPRRVHAGSRGRGAGGRRAAREARARQDARVGIRRQLPAARTCCGPAAGRSRSTSRRRARRRAARRSPGSSSTTGPGACSRSGPGRRWRGGWRAGIPGAVRAGGQRAVGLDRRCASRSSRRSLRPPLRMLHLDLAVLLAFSVSYAFFGARDLDVSVPSAYPLLAYLLGRMLWIACPRRPEPRRCGSLLPAGRAALRPRVRCSAFRVVLNVVERQRDRRRLRRRDRRRPAARRRARCTAASRPTTRTATRTARSPTRPTCRSSCSGRGAGPWDDLPAAHAAAVAFDLACVAGLWLAGRRLGGPTLGLLLAYLWVACPFTLLVAELGRQRRARRRARARRLPLPRPPGRARRRSRSSPA